MYVCVCIYMRPLQNKMAEDVWKFLLRGGRGLLMNPQGAPPAPWLTQKAWAQLFQAGQCERCVSLFVRLSLSILLISKQKKRSDRYNHSLYSVRSRFRMSLLTFFLEEMKIPIRAHITTRKVKQIQRQIYQILSLFHKQSDIQIPGTTRMKSFYSHLII